MSKLVIPSICLVSSPGDPRGTGCFLGGAPQLPDGMAWPRDGSGRPLVHVAQIALHALPRKLILNENELGLPTFPTTGTIFVFAACADEEFYEMEEGTVQVLYTEQDVSDFAPVSPPPDAPAFGPDAAVSQNQPWYDLRIYAPEALQIVSPPKSYPRVPLLIGADVTLGTEMQHSAHAPVADTSTQPQISSDSFQLWKDWCAGQMPASDYAAKCNNLKLVPNWLPNTALGMSGSKTDGDGKEIKYGDFGANFTWSWIMVERIALTLWAETARAVGRDAKLGVSAWDSNLQQESLMRRVAFALKPPRSAPANLKNQSLLARLLFAIKTPPPVEPKPPQRVRKRSWHEAPIADIFGGDVPETCRAWVEEAAAHDPVSEVPVERAAAFREFLIGLDARIPEVIRDKVETPRKDKNGEIVEGDPIIRNVARSTLSEDYDDGQAAIVLGSMLQRGLFGGLESAWPYIMVNGVPAGMTDDMLGRMANRVGCTRHRMFGAGLSIQDAPERMSDKVLLLEVDTDGMANMMWGDSGALQLWIDPQALAAGRFDTVEATAEGC